MIQPVHLPWSETCDANGNATHTEQLTQGKFYSLSVFIQAAGNPTFTYGRRKAPLIPSGGRVANIGPLLFMSGDSAEVVITAATPNTQTSGFIFGWQADKLNELPPVLPNSSGAIQTYMPEIFINSVTAQAGTIQSYSFIPPAGTTAIGWTEDQNAPGNPHGFSLSGNSTLVQYFSQVETDPGFVDGATGTPWAVEVPMAIEPKGFTFTLDATGHALCTVQLFAYLSEAVIYIRQNPTDRFSVSLQLSNAPAWLAPVSPVNTAVNFSIGLGSIAAGATVNLCNAIGPSSKVYVYEVNLHLKGAANSFGELQDTAGLTLRGMDFSINDNYVFNFHGAQAPALGKGLQVKNSSGAASGSINGGGNFGSS
jgi:hypothetical protein